jgi:CDP-4-dehydro-6-deoxyglucose reductase
MIALHFFVARDGGEPFASAVFDDSLRVGDEVTVWGPYGDFVLVDSQRPLVFAACDLAFAPVKSLIEHALSFEASPSLSLFWLATRDDGHFMLNQCRAWSEALDAFEYALFTDADVAHGAQQVLHAMRADLFDIECDFYVAGPDPFVAALESGLRAAGVPQVQIRVGGFG